MLHFTIAEFIKAFLSIFIIMDPFGTIPILLSITKKYSEKEKRRIVAKAVMIAAVLLLIFILFGMEILSFFGISINSFRIAGGIILLIMGIEYVLDLKFRKEAAEDYKIAVVPLATPLITGPGVLTASIIIVMHYGLLIAIIASALSILVTWLIFYHSTKIFKILGKQGNEIVSRIMGLMLTAIAIEFIIQGIKGIM